MPGLLSEARPLDWLRSLLAPDPGWKYSEGPVPMKSRTPLDPIYGAPQIMQTEFRPAIPGMAREMGGSLLNVLEAPMTGVMPTPADLLNVLGGALAPVRRGAPAAKTLASRSVTLYNPPARPDRVFSRDYPHGGQVDASGRLTHDIEGRPLEVGGRIVGRRVAGGADEAVPATQFDAIAKEATGRGTERVAQSGNDLGSVSVDPHSRLPKQVFLSKDLTAAQLSRVYAHEIGHVIDQLAGEIPTKGLNTELKALYNTINNPNRSRDGTKAASWGRPMTPGTSGYTGDDVPRELMAEAIRAYIVNPNYMKTEAPKTAAVIRKYVNAHPELRRIIQFNVAAPPPPALLLQDRPTPAAAPDLLSTQQPAPPPSIMDNRQPKLSKKTAACACAHRRRRYGAN